MTTITLRPLTVDDLTDVIAVEAELFPEPWSWRMYVEELTELPGRHYVCAVVDGHFAGWAGCSVQVGEGHVMTIGTLVPFRRLGVARALLEDLIEAATERGASRLILEVAASNTAAQALYRKCHFAPVGLRRGYYAHGGDALVMLRALGADA
jgi:[ribosomal protein S18]-alanine N-acetyltransferase